MVALISRAVRVEHDGDVSNDAIWLACLAAVLRHLWWWGRLRVGSGAVISGRDQVARAGRRARHDVDGEGDHVNRVRLLFRGVASLKEFVGVFGDRVVVRAVRAAAGR